jgi:hypothetical protein
LTEHPQIAPGRVSGCTMMIASRSDGHSRSDRYRALYGDHYWPGIAKLFRFSAIACYQVTRTEIDRIPAYSSCSSTPLASFNYTDAKRAVDPIARSSRGTAMDNRTKRACRVVITPTLIALGTIPGPVLPGIGSDRCIHPAPVPQPIMLARSAPRAPRDRGRLYRMRRPLRSS